MINSLNPYLVFIMGSIFLYFSSEIIIKHSIIISEKYNISKLTVGIIIMAFGTSLPELFVSLFAIINNNDQIVIGNIMGSNIANIALVFGTAIVIKPFILEHNRSLNFNLSSMLVISVIFLLFLSNNNIDKIDGSILIFLCLAYLYVLTTKYSSTKISNYTGKSIEVGKSILSLLLGFLFIYLGSKYFVTGALGIAENLGMSELSVGMTIVALGTSAPELFTTIIAAKNNEHKLAVGNIIGSNIFNITIVGGVVSLINDIDIMFNNLLLMNSIILISVSLFFIIVVILIKKIKYKIFGYIFLVIYFGFIYLNFYSNN